LFILTVLFPCVALAQPNYHEGFVIKNNGDSVKGFVNYREWVYSPESVEFRTEKTGPTTKYTANVIKGFGVNGFVTYRSYVGDITMNKNIFPNISSGIDTTHLVKAIFLKPVRSGLNINLYYNNEVNKDRFFIAEGNGTPVELKYYEYYTSGSTEEYGNVYKTQLELLAEKYNKSSEKITRDLELAKYELIYITHIADEINGIDIKKADSAASVNRPSNIRFIAGVAGNYTVNSNPGSTSFSPKFNAGIDVFFNPDVQQLVLRLELGYTWSTGLIPVQQPGNYGVVTVNRQITQYSFSINPQLIFNIYNTDNLKVYIDAGASANFSSYDQQQNTRPFWVSVPVQTGIVFKRNWEVFVSYAFKAKYFNAGFDSTNQSTCAGVKRLF